MSVVLVLISSLLGTPAGLQARPQADQSEVAELILALQDEDEEVRLIAASLLAEDAPRADKASLKALSRTVRDQEEKHRVRSEAVRALASLGGQQRTVQRSLMELAANEQQDWRVRASCLQALWTVDQGASLTRLLGDAGVSVRTKGPNIPLARGLAENQIAALAHALKDQDARVRRLAGLALAVARNVSSVPALKRTACEDPDFATRQTARAALDGMGVGSVFSPAHLLGTLKSMGGVDGRTSNLTPFLLASGGCLHGVF